MYISTYEGVSSPVCEILQQQKNHESQVSLFFKKDQEHSEDEKKMREKTMGVMGKKIVLKNVL